MAVATDNARSLAGWIMSGLFAIIMAIGGWAINTTLADIREDIKEIKAGTIATQAQLNSHLIQHPDKDLRNSIAQHELRLQLLEKE